MSRLDDLVSGLGGQWAICDEDLTVVSACASGPFVVGEAVGSAFGVENSRALSEQAMKTAVMTDTAVLAARRLEHGRTLLWVEISVPQPTPFLLRLMGGFQLLRDGQTVASDANRERVHDLLIAVAALRATSMARAEMASLLWPQPNQKAARDNLKTLLRRLPLLQARVGAPAPLVFETERSVSLNRSLVTLDLTEIMTAFTFVTQMLQRGNQAAAGKFALSVAQRLLTAEAGPVADIELERLPGLEPVARRAEVELAGLVALAVGQLHTQNAPQSVPVLLRRGLAATPHTTALAWTAVREAMVLGDQSTARQIYDEHYVSASRDPLPFEQMVKLALSSRGALSRPASASAD